MTQQKNIWLILIAVVLMAYANVVLKLRITALGGVSAASWWAYFLSMMLDPLTWSALIAAIIAEIALPTDNEFLLRRVNC
jgi:hypothetical protein